MIPPAKSPGRSADAVLLTTIRSIKLAGMISNEKAFLSGSDDGNTALFKMDELYRSARPLIITNLFS